MIDRIARDKLIGAISEYLNDAITAFAFDDRIGEVAAATGDETVRHIVDALWFHYDDCKDHKVVLTTEEWNYFQRLILVLQSESHIQMSRSRRWSIRQAVALAALSCFAVLLLYFHFSYWLVAVPFGLVSMALAF